MKFDFRSVPEMFFSKARERGDRVFLRHRVDGAWAGVTWAEMGRMAEETALGLLLLGVQKGESVNILSENCVPWIAADMGITSTGAITTAIYASNTPDECAYIFDHSEARVVFVEDKKQLDKLVKARAKMPRLSHIVIFKPEGAPEFPGLISFDDLLKSGREAGEEIKKAFRERMDSISPGDLITYIYTSGTTGPPKGAMLTHGNVLFQCSTYSEMQIVKHGDTSLSILPMAHALERVIFYISMCHEGIISISDDIYKTAQYLKEVRPKILICVPRVVEKVYEKVQSEVAASPPLKQKLFKWAIGAGKQAAWKENRGQALGMALSFKKAVAQALVFKKIQDGTGGNLSFLGCGGAPLSPEIVEFFCAAGVPLVQAWGMTETTAPATQIIPNEIRYDAVGKPIKGVDVELTEDGEIRVRGPIIFKGYFKNPEETANTLRDGWCYTGDLGEIDSEGFVKIIGRKKELIITAGGKNISPLNLEFLFMSSRYINQAVIVGDSKPFLTALFTLALDEIKKLAEEKGLRPENGNPLELHPGIREIVEKEVAEKNESLPRYMTIKKFCIIPGEFTQEGGELTPTMKTKKKVIFNKYADLIETMYAG